MLCQMLLAFEWYFSERVKRAYERMPRVRRDQLTTKEQDELLDRCDFGIFLDFVSLPQKDATGERSEDDEACFRCGLKNLDSIYAHQGIVTLLCTQIPEVARDAARKAGLTLREYHQRGWPTFERCE